MISHGDGGSNTNASGLPFEKCVLRNHIPGKTYNIGGKDYVYIRQGNFTNHMSDLKDAYWEHDKKPDGAYVSSDRKTVILFECKHQIITRLCRRKTSHRSVSTRRVSTSLPGCEFSSRIYRK